MGRIAEAIKKAKAERDAKLSIDGGGGTPAMTLPAPLGEPTLRQVWQATGLVRSGRNLRMAKGPQPGLRSLFPRKPRPAPHLAPTPPWDVHHTVVAHTDRSGSITEQYRAVRTWLLRRVTTGEKPCLAITSSVPREGKTVTTANLAVTMAEVRHMRVLVVDGDLRQGALARLYRAPNTPGLADVLAGRVSLADTIQETPLGNLSFLPAGVCHDLNPTELLNSTTAAHVFDEIRDRYHYVLVDTPPVQRLSDVGVIGALCSGVLMVVRMHKTPAHHVRQSVHWLQSNNLPVTGCVAAACSVRAARFTYERGDDD